MVSMFGFDFGKGFFVDIVFGRAWGWGFVYVVVY